MAISTPTLVTASGDTANSATYTTIAVTLTAGRRYILSVAGYRSSGADTITSVVHDAAGTPLNFAEILNPSSSPAIIQGWDQSSRRTLDLWFVDPASTTGSAAITITWTNGQSACEWQLIEIASGFDTGGNGAGGSFPQFATATGIDAAPATTLGSFGDANSLTLVYFGWGLGVSTPSETITETEGRSELDDHTGERDGVGLHYQNPNGSDTTVGGTLSAANNWGILALEVKAGGGAQSATSTDSATAASIVALAVPASTAEAISEIEVALSSGAPVDSDSAQFNETEAASKTQSAADTETATSAESLDALVVDTAATEAGTLGAIAALDGLTVASDAGTLAETAAASKTQDVVQTDAFAATDVAGAVTVEGAQADAGALSSTQSATQAGIGDQPATDSDTATESASAALVTGLTDADVAAIIDQGVLDVPSAGTDSGALNETSAHALGGNPTESGTLSDAAAAVLAAAGVDSGALTSAAVATGPAPTGVDTDTFTLTETASATYHFPPKRGGARLMRGPKTTRILAR